MKESDAASEMNQPLPQNYHPLVEKLRDDCLNYGESGIKGFGITLLSLAKDNKDPRKITFEQFKQCLLQKQISLTLTEVTDLFRLFEHENNGLINYDELIFNIRPPMSINRFNLIKRAFAQIDRFNRGKVTIDDLKSSYSCKRIPKFQNGEWSEEQCLLNFCEQFDIKQHKDGIVTLEEFINFYAGISAYIDSDPFFDVYVRNCWKL